MNDLKLALRRLRGAPGFTAVATLTLALAIGANAAIFSFADAVLFRPLPYEDAGRVYNVLMMDVRTGARYIRTPYRQLRSIEERARGVVGVGVLERVGSLTVVSQLGVETVAAAEITGNYFDLLGARAARGRLLTPIDADAGGRPAVLTWTSFERRFAGDDAVVGSAVALGDQTFDIVGVLPPDFVFPSAFVAPAEIITLAGPIPADDGGTFHPIVRLAPGATPEQVDAEMAALAAESSSRDRSADAEVPVLADVRSILYPTGRPVMRLLLAAAGLVLLIGCANLANMLLARTRMREREIGVQAALGATRLGRVRPLLIESLVIGVGGGVAALLATSLIFDFLLRQVPPAALGQAPVGLGLRVVGFTLGLGVAAGLIFAAVPAWRASRLDALVLIRAGGGDRSGQRSIGRPLLAAQVALAIVLVFGAVMVTRAFVSVLRVPLGFDPENVVTVGVFVPLEGGLARQAFYLRAIDALSQRADVVAAGAAGSMPFDGGAPDEGVVSPESGERLDAGIFHVLPGYFETAGIELLRGRLPMRADVDGDANVAVVAGSTARSLFGDRDPIGETVISNVGRRLTVVGVVSEVTQTLAVDMEPPVYVIPAEATRRMTLVARTRSRGDAVLADIRGQIGAMAPGVPVRASWWDDTINNVTAYRNPRFQTIVLGSFAGLALGLTALGVFGLVAFLVASRMRDLGIRLAIGATPGSLTVRTVGQVLVPALAGVGIGLVATRGLARLVEAQLYDVDTSDPATLAAAVAVVAVAALIAAYIPARRAACVDPMVVLRME